MPPKNHPPIAFSMERGERVAKLKAKGLTYRQIGKQVGVSVSRAFFILREYNQRLNLIKNKHWTYGLSKRALGILFVNDVMTMAELRAFVKKHGINMPVTVQGVGPKTFAELTAFAAHEHQ